MKNFFLGLLFLAVGIGVAIFGRGMLREAGESESWPSTNGVIAVSTVEQSRTYDSKRKKNKTVYHANIDYQYKVDGRQFHGDKISFGGSATDRKAAYRLTAKYPKNKEVLVYYEPGAPENAVLEPGKTWLTYLPFLSGMLFAIVGAGLALKPLLKILLLAVLAVTRR